MSRGTPVRSSTYAESLGFAINKIYAPSFLFHYYNNTLCLYFKYFNVELNLYLDPVGKVVLKFTQLLI